MGARLKLYPLCGVDVHTIDVENPVEMRSGGAARGTGVAQNVAALHLRTRCDNELRHVKIHGLKALAVVNADRIAENVELLRERDVACGDGTDGFAGRGALVHAAVIFAGRLPVMEAPDAEGRGHAAGNRRNERILPRAAVGDLFLEAGELRDFFRRGMERLYLRAEFYVLRWKKRLANDDSQLLLATSIVPRDGDRGRTGQVLDGNGKQAEMVAGGLPKELRGTAKKRRRRVFGGAGDAQGLAELDLFGSDGAILCDGRSHGGSTDQESH